MVHARRLFGLLALLALASPFAKNAHADTTNFTGKFTADSDVVALTLNTSVSQMYTFSTTSFAAGGLVPVLTLFRSTGGVPLAFGETDNSDVSFTQNLGPGSYILALTEDPNVFTTTYSAGPLFATSPTITGDLCGVTGGKFLDVFDNCSQRTSSYAVAITSNTAVTPEPSTWLLVMPAVALLFAVRYRRTIA